MKGDKPTESEVELLGDSPEAEAAPTLKSYQLAFLLAAVFTLVSLSSFSALPARVIVFLFAPANFVLLLLPWNPMESGYVFVPMLAAFSYLFGVCFILVWGYRKSSTRLRRAVGLCALFGLAGWWALKQYETGVDWTSRGLDPARPGFKPPVVLLAGTLESDFLGGSAKAEFFEIRMRGTNWYYAERWKGAARKSGSVDRLTLALPGFYGTRNRWSLGMRVRGGGGSFEGDAGLQIGQRLWRGNQFVGASTEDEAPIGQGTERFAKLKQVGPYRIPQRIEWIDHDSRQILQVRRVEFFNRPDTNWFAWIKAKYFEQSSLALKTNLNEAGWAAEFIPPDPAASGRVSNEAPPWAEHHSTTNQVLDPANYEVAEACFREFFWRTNQVLCLTYGTAYSPLPVDFMKRFSGNAPRVITSTAELSISPDRSITHRSSGREAFVVSMRTLRVRGDGAEASVRFTDSASDRTQTHYLKKDSAGWKCIRSSSP